VKRLDPHTLQKQRSIPGDEGYREMDSSPDVIRRVSRGTRTMLAKAAPCHFRHREQ